MPETQQTPGRGVVAGLDYGTVRIGVALSDAGRRLATPHETYNRRDRRADSRWFRKLVDEHQVTQFVVGLPVHLDGRESSSSLEARRFAVWLREVTGLEVVFYDERFTTSEAEQHLQAAQLTSRRRKSRRDALAAQIMLTDFLESGGQDQQAPGPLDA